MIGQNFPTVGLRSKVSSVQKFDRSTLRPEIMK